MEPDGVSRKYELDIHAVQFGSTHRSAKCLKVLRRIDDFVPLRYLQSPMDIGESMEQLNDLAQRGLDLDVVCLHCRSSDAVDRRGELVVDSVVQLEQKDTLA
jgi:hypothetical protein